MDEVQNLLQAFQALSAAILKARQAEQSVAPLIVQSVPLFARLRALYRLANLELQSNKASKALQRQEVDYAELELQNLAYERQHLEREIKRCEEYESVYQDVDLPPADAPQINETPTDAHDIMLARLNLELAERQRLEAEKKDLLARKLRLTKDNAEKKAALDVLDKQLEDFIASAKEIQQKMSKHNTPQKDEDTQVITSSGASAEKTEAEGEPLDA